MSIRPFFSIVVINLNNGDGLRATLESIKSQHHLAHEVIFVDGNSTDHSHDVANAYDNLISSRIIGKDTGIYNAMNLGVSRSHGSYVLFLNSGDSLYSPTVLSDVFEKARLEPNNLFFGYAKIKNEVDSWLFPPKHFTRSHDTLLTWLNRREPNHQAMFFPREFYKKNLYDESLRIIADKKFKRAALLELEHCFIPITISSFELGGTSNKIMGLKHISLYIDDYRRYYLEPRDDSKDIVLFYIYSLKVILKFLGQFLFGDPYWKILKLMRNYPMA